MSRTEKVGALLAFATRLRLVAHTAGWRPAFAHLGAKSRIVPPFRGSGLHLVSLGNGVYLGTGSWLRAESTGKSPVIVVGDHVRTSGQTTISALLGVRVGNRVSMARAVYIADHTHAYEQPGVAVRDQGVKDVRPVHIGDGTWIGTGAVIGPGVTVGERAVVGAYAVVVEDVPPQCLVVGSPARVVKTW